MLKDSWKCISSMRMHLKAFPSVEEDINKGKTFIVSPLPLTLPSHKFPLLIDIKQNAVFGIRFLAAAQTNRKEGRERREEKSIDSSFGIIPPNRSVFPGMMSAKNNLLGSSSGPLLSQAVEVGYFLAINSFVSTLVNATADIMHESHKFVFDTAMMSGCF